MITPFKIHPSRTESKPPMPAFGWMVVPVETGLKGPFPRTRQKYQATLWRLAALVRETNKETDIDKPN
jgi:hypothetical protein